MTSVTASSIALRWNAAPSDVDDPVVSYIVQFRSKSLPPPRGVQSIASREYQPHHVISGGGFREIHDVTAMEYDVSGLEAFTRYELRVVSVNSVGRSQPSHSVDATTSQLGTPFMLPRLLSMGVFLLTNRNRFWIDRISHSI